MDVIRCPSIVDFEASGFGTTSFPIEVGIAKDSGERYCSLIQPDPSWVHWSDEAEQIHGLSRDTIERKGKPAVEVCNELNQFLGRGQVFSDAWAHDQRWLSALFEVGQVTPLFTLRAIEHILHEGQYRIWDETKEQIIDTLKLVRHRASSDAFLIQQTYIQSNKRLREESGGSLSTSPGAQTTKPLSSIN